MSCTCSHCGTEALAPYTRDDDAFGVTNTKTAQRQFAQRLRGVLGRLNARIREAIVERDPLQLQEADDTEALVEDVPEQTQQAPTRRQRIAGFFKWLQNQLQTHFLGVAAVGTAGAAAGATGATGAAGAAAGGAVANQFTRRAYATGIRFATRQTRDKGVPVPSVDVDEQLESNPHNRKLRVLQQRVFQNLEGVTEDMEKEIRKTLLEGVDDGKNPTEIARDITNRVDKIGKHRGTLIARTEVINAHSTASVEQYREISRNQDIDIGLNHVGRLTANDTRVCPFCRGISDVTLTFSEFLRGKVRWGTQEMRLGVPSHPQGRCAPIPVTGVDMSSLPSLAERLPNTIAGKPVTVVRA